VTMLPMPSFDPHTDQPDAAVLPITRPHVYTVNQVATMLGVSRGSAYQLCRTGQVPAIKLGDRWVIPKKRFHSWLDNQPDQDRDDQATGSEGTR
jgi:excisionase family DNA binding protein